MCEIQKLRASVEQILTAAAEEIFVVFKRSIVEIEEKLSDSSKHIKRNQRLPDTVHQTDILIPPEQQGHSPHVDQEDPGPPHIKDDQVEEWIRQEGEKTMNPQLLPEYPTLIQKLWIVKEEPPLEQKDRSHSLGHVDPEPIHIKEEVNLWTNEEGEQLQGLEEADITQFSFTPPCVKSEYDEDKVQSSQLHQSQTEENTGEPEEGDDYGELEPDNIQNNDFPVSNVTCQTTDQFTEDDKTPQFLSVFDTQMTVQPTNSPFSCSVCHKHFLVKNKLTKHMIVHASERPFTCSVCKKSFARKFEVKQHMLVHTREKPFNCSVCKKSFARKSEVKQHMPVHTGEKPFSCSICKKGFARKFEVKQHMLVHTREKSFSCPVCKKSFARKNNLKEHMPIHTGEKPFNCSVCKKDFALKSNLKKHLLTHTEEQASIYQVHHDSFFKQVNPVHLTFYTRQ